VGIEETGDPRMAGERGNDNTVRLCYTVVHDKAFYTKWHEICYCMIKYVFSQFVIHTYPKATKATKYPHIY